MINDGKIEKTFHKSLLPTYDVFDEERYFKPALEPGFFEIKGKKIGVTICEDVWNDIDFKTSRKYKNDPMRSLSEKRVDVIINLSASLFLIGKQSLIYD